MAKAQAALTESLAGCRAEASSAAVAESAAAESAAKSAVSKPSDGASGQKQPGLGDTCPPPQASLEEVPSKSGHS